MGRASGKVQLKIDYSTHFAVAVCIGAFTDSRASVPKKNYTEQVLEKLALFDRISAAFKKKRLGSEYDRDADSLRILCRFPLENREDYPDVILLPLIQKLEKENNVRLLCGIGLPSANKLHLEESLGTSKDAFGLSFFEDGAFFEYQKCRKRYNISFEDYEIYSEKAFKSILIKSPDAINEIDNCLELIRRIHYGNKNAVIMRAMNYTGEMAYRLHRYGFLDADFYPMQDALQEKVLSARTSDEVKQFIHEYYVSLLSEIFRKSHTGRGTLIEHVKAYIRENYMMDLKASDLASIACVSSGYFSHMFKNETGESFKNYLTKVRLNAAVELLSNPDYRIYEISDKVGYNNVRNFVEAFHKKYGCYPSDYRKKMKDAME